MSLRTYGKNAEFVSLNLKCIYGLQLEAIIILGYALWHSANPIAINPSLSCLAAELHMTLTYLSHSVYELATKWFIYSHVVIYIDLYNHVVMQIQTFCLQ